MGGLPAIGRRHGWLLPVEFRVVAAVRSDAVENRPIAAVRQSVSQKQISGRTPVRGHGINRQRRQIRRHQFPERVRPSSVMVRAIKLHRQRNRQHVPRHSKPHVRFDHSVEAGNHNAYWPRAFEKWVHQGMRSRRARLGCRPQQDRISREFTGQFQLIEWSDHPDLLLALCNFLDPGDALPHQCQPKRFAFRRCIKQLPENAPNLLPHRIGRIVRSYLQTRADDGQPVDCQRIDSNGDEMGDDRVLRVDCAGKVKTGTNPLQRLNVVALEVRVYAPDPRLRTRDCAGPN